MVTHEAATLSNFDIFLSHSGDQKPFVRELYKELRIVNHSRVFFDEDSRQSLPRGSHLATNILSAIRCCKLGVVVISQSFIKSLWPMMELQYLMKQKESENACTIYPIFYEMQPSDLVKPQNLRKWRKRWVGLIKKAQNEPSSCPISVDIKTWPEALGKLRILAGTIIPASSSSSELQQISKHKLLDEIISEICDLLPPPPYFDDDFVKGKDRTARVIEKEFEYIQLLDNKNASSNVLVLGVVGIGGSGKTTLCETMVDFYCRHEFLGRCVVLKFPTEETEDMAKLIQGFKTALKIITNTPLLNIEEISDIKQAISLLKQANKARKYFLAIDNVWEWSLECVYNIIIALTSNNFIDGVAKVIITSRSESIFSSNFTRRIIDVPSLTKEDALEVILSNFGYQQLSNKSQVEGLLDICSFSSTFHPLLLKTLGNILMQAIYNDSWEEYINELENICFGLKNVKCLNNHSFLQEELEDKVILKVLKINYNLLGHTLKNIFMDIAILYPRSVRNIYEFSTFKGYENINIKVQVQRLQHFGLLRCSNQLEIHDLYKELAKREAKASGCFLLWCDGVATIVPESLSLSKVTRIVNCKSEKYGKRGCISISDFKALDFTHLAYDKIEYLDIQADDLNVLYNAWKKKDTVVSKSTFFQGVLGALISKANFIMERLMDEHAPINLFPLGHSLSILRLECGHKTTRLDGLSGATNLQVLELSRCYALKEISDMSNLKRLKELTIDGASGGAWYTTPTRNKLLKMPNLSSCTKLSRVRLSSLKTLKTLSDLQCPPSLQRLVLGNNPNLVDVGDIGSFGKQLVELEIDKCTSLETFMVEGGALSDQKFPSLERIYVKNCVNLKVFPRINKLSRLKTIIVNPHDLGRSCGNADFDLHQSRFEQNITSISLTVHREQFAANRNQLAAFSGLPNLEDLSLEVVDSLYDHEEKLRSLNAAGSDLCNPCGAVLSPSNYEHHYDMAPSLTFLSQIPNLKYLYLKNFDFIRSLEELSCLTNLYNLRLKNFNSLESLPSEMPSSLTEIKITGCAKHSESLDHWLLTCNLESLTNLGILNLEGFTSVKRLDAFSSLTSLWKLNLKGFSSLESVSICNLRMLFLYLSQCPSLRMLHLNGPLMRLIELECPASVENLMEVLNGCTSTLAVLRLYHPEKCKILGVLAGGALILDLFHHTELKKLTLEGFPASSPTSFFCPHDRMSQQNPPLKLWELECPATVQNLMELLNSCTLGLYRLRLYMPSKFKINIDDRQALESPGLADIEASTSAMVDLSHHTQLEFLTLKGFPASSLTNFVCKLCPPSLGWLTLVGNGDDENDVNPVINLTSLTRLEYFEIRDFKYVRSLRGVSCPTSLKSLRIRNCSALEELPDSNRLFGIRFDDCGQLKSLVHSQGKIIRRQIEFGFSKKVKREFGVNHKGESFYIDSEIRSGFPITICFLDRR